MNISILNLPQETLDKFMAAGVETIQRLGLMRQSQLIEIGLNVDEVEMVRAEHKRVTGTTEKTDEAAEQTIIVKAKEENPTEFASYDIFDQTLQTELRKSAEGFVRIGYLLKLARDTDILKESGFGSVAEYAKERYGLTKDVVSRYISINDKFSEDGNSTILKEQYQGYGIAKLQEMLTMPQETLELLSPQMTKSDIVTVKKEIEEEKAVTPLEAMAEQMETGPVEGSMLEQFWKEYFRAESDLFCKVWSEIVAIYSGKNVGKLLDIIEPSGVGVKTAKVKGIGKLMLSIKGEEQDVELMNVRSGEKESHTWAEIIKTLAEVIGNEDTRDAKGTWEAIYSEPYPQKQEVAPVQQKEEKNVHQRQESTGGAVKQPSTEQSNQETKSEAKNEANGQQEEANSEEKVEEQIPGQTEITKDFPELCPENAEKTENEPLTNPSQTHHEPIAAPKEEKSEAVAAVHEITEDVVQEGETVRAILLSGDEAKIRKAIMHKFGQAYSVDLVWNTWMEMIINV